MSRATPELKVFAQQLLDLEAATTKKSGKNRRNAFRVCEKLRAQLTRLAGAAGFRSLLSSALAMAGEEVPWLKELRVKADGSLEGIDEAVARPSEGAQGEVVLIAHLVGLLVTFIGEGLTLSLVEDAWPEASFGGLDSGMEK